MSRILYIDLDNVARIVNGRRALSLAVVTPKHPEFKIVEGGKPSPKRYAPKKSANQSTPPAAA